MGYLRLLALGLAYFAAAGATIATTRIGGGVSVIWIASAVMLAGLSVRPPREWWGVAAVCAVASFLATGLWGFGWAAAGPLALVNISEALLCAHLLYRRYPDESVFASSRGIFAFILCAGCIAPMASGIVGAGVAAAYGQPYLASWMNWSVGHGLGAITFAPILVLLAQSLPGRRAPRSSPAAVAAGVGMLALVAAVTALTFAQTRLPLLFLPILPAIIAAFRMGRVGAAASLAIITVIGTFATIRGLGPMTLIDAGLVFRLQFLQLFLAVMAVILLPVAAELERRKSLYKRLLDSEARYRLVIDRSGDIIMSMDAAGTIQFVSPSIATTGAFTPDGLIGTPALALVHPDDRARMLAMHRAVLADPARPHIVEYRGVHPDGAARWFETHTQAVCDDAKTVTSVVSAIRDISHRKRLEESLVREAHTDELTRLLNRRGLMQAIGRLPPASGGTRHALAVFDIDRFKLVNDLHGHAAGDVALQHFARIASAGLRQGDLLCRLGGEEFALFLENTPVERASIICERIRTNIAGSRILTDQGAVISLTVSCGLSGIDAAQPSVARALGEADAALYRAKSGGRNRLERAA